MEYVVGFLFDNDKESVLLVRKNKPQWQAGYLNGIGGKIEADESPDEAIHREFREETGLKDLTWVKFLTLEFSGGRVHFFKDFTELVIAKYMSVNDIGESIERWDCGMLNSWVSNSRTIPNLKWIILLALDKDNLVANVKEMGS